MRKKDNEKVKVKGQDSVWLVSGRKLMNDRDWVSAEGQTRTVWQHQDWEQEARGGVELSRNGNPRGTTTGPRAARADTQLVLHT